MAKALEGGVNFFDNAEAYGGGKAEESMGRVIKKLGCKRSDLVISTKLFWGGKGPNDVGLSRKHIIEGMNASLERLQLSYVDVVFCHRPDPNTPIEETVRAMNYLIDQGKAFYWGTSEWSAEQITTAHTIAEKLGLIPPIVEQPQYNLFHRERVEVEYGPLYKNYGLGTTIWSPLASGLLTGKYNDGIPEDSRFGKGKELGINFAWKEKLDSEKGVGFKEKINKLASIATELNCTLSQLAIAWCLKNPNVSTVITGASRPSQVEENLQALSVEEKLDAGIMAKIEDILSDKQT